ncbi:MAG: S-adenosyl-l-methionine hydroxide adenosyltransferase family protein [Chitinophagales bacterium]
MSNSVITLLSDLGTRDTTVTVSRAILMRYAPESAIVDISHNVAQYDLQQAAYLLLSAYKNFAQGSIHVLLADVFAGGAPRMLVAEKEGYFFIAPDNGVLPLAFGAQLENTKLCFEFSKPYSFNEWVNNAGNVIEALQQGRNIIFPPCDIKKAPRVLQPRILPDGVECNILYIDRYENVVLDITKEQFDAMVKGRPFKIQIMRTEEITSVSNNYNDVEKDDPLCRFNSAGFLEIAFNHAPAASSLGLGSFSTGNLRYQTIKILFQREAGE